MFGCHYQKELENRMPGMTLENIAKACEGTYVGSDEHLKDYITGAVTDSRKVHLHNLFIPIKGERVDGHDFIPEVFEKGALAVLSEHELTEPAGPYILVESTTEAMKKLAEKLDSGYDYILLDAPAGLSSGFELACAAADRAIVVSTADEVCVRSVNITAAGIRRSGITDVRLVINRFDEKAVAKGKLLNIDDVIDATCAQLLGIVPEDAYVSHCAVRGEKLPPLSSASRAFSRIARRVCGENVPLFG